MRRFLSILISAVMIAGMFTSLSLGTSAVTKKAKKVSLKKSSATLKIKTKNGKTVYGKTTVKVKKAKGVKVKKITYKSSDKKIAKVSKKGKVTAKSSGKAKITVKIKYKFKKKTYKKSLAFKVEVKDLHSKKVPEPVTTVPAPSAPATTEAQAVETAPIQTETPSADETMQETDPATDAAEIIETDMPTVPETEAGEIEETTGPAEIIEITAPVTAEDSTPAETTAETNETAEAVSTIAPQTDPAPTQGETETKELTFNEKLSAFSNKLYNMCSEAEANNYVMSPISVYMALSMLYQAGDDGVKDDIKSFVEMSDSEIAKTGELFNSLVSEYSNYDFESGEDVLISKLSLSNSIWFDNNIKMDSDALKDLADTLYCEAHNTSFLDDNDAANDEIREFVNKQTEGLINENFNLDKSTVFALINTLYFKDVWSEETSKLSTAKKDFITENGAVNCEFLYGDYVAGQVQQTDKSYYFYTTTAHGYKIKFVLPKDGYTLKEAMNASDLNEINNNSAFNVYDENGNIHCTRCIFPRFKIESDTPLDEILKSRGILPNAFSAFNSPLTYDKNMELCVSKIIHKTVIDVNPEGVEGAAVTIIAVKDNAAPEPVKMIYHDFVLDKNFGFIVTDRNNVVLFEGQVKNPQPVS